MQTCWFAGAITFFGPAFRAPEYIAMAATSVGGGIVLAAMVHSLKLREKHRTKSVQMRVAADES